MKKSAKLILLALHISLAAGAQETVTLRVPNFVRPLVERWVVEYKKNISDVDFQFVSGKSQDNKNSISFTADDTEGVFFGRYAVLPITTDQSEASQLVGSHRLNAKKLKNLFFVKDDFDDSRKESKAEKSLHIFTGSSQQSASRLYAEHFKHETADFKGKKISGDDSFLNTAISRDPLGVTVNSLSNIFDLTSRRLNSGIVLLPLDLDKQANLVLGEPNLDSVIALLEQSQYDVVPVGRTGVVYDHNNPLLADFVRWILSDGVQYLHQYGLLQLSQKELTIQQHRATSQDVAQK